MNLVDRIKHLCPCEEAVAWLQDYHDAETAWGECLKPQWMFWLIGKCERSEPWSNERKPLLACALDCAETVRHLWPEKQRAQIEAAIQTLRDWIAGTVTIDQAKKARKSLYAAADAAYAANASDAAYAAYAAANAAANASNAAANAAYAAANASYAAAYASDAAYAAYAASRKKSEKQCADIVRRHFPSPPRIVEIVT